MSKPHSTIVPTEQASESDEQTPGGWDHNNDQAFALNLSRPVVADLDSVPEKIGGADPDQLLDDHLRADIDRALDDPDHLYLLSRVRPGHPRNKWYGAIDLSDDHDTGQGPLRA